MSDPFSFIEQCYGAVVEPDRWPAVLNSLSEITGAYGCGLVSHDASRTGSTLQSESLSIADDDFKNYWWQHDTRINKSKKIKFRNGDIATDHRIVGADEKRRDPFFQDFCRSYNLDEFAAYFANDPLGGMMTVSIFRGSKKGNFDDTELRMLKLVAPHIARAFELTVSLRVAQAINVGILEGLGINNVGAIQLDHSGRIQYLNEAAARVSIGVLILNEKMTIKLVDPRHKMMLDHMIHHALPSFEEPTGGSMLLLSLCGQPTHQISAIPIRPVDNFLHQIGIVTGGVLVTIKELDASRETKVRFSLQRMGLTAGEANVAEKIGLGISPKEVAELNKVSEATVRTQIKSIFCKLSIHRQSELVVLVSRLGCLI